MGTLDTSAIGYVRVSTDEQAASGLGLDAQRAQLRAACRARRWRLVDVEADEGVSGAGHKPALERALARLDAGEASVLVVGKIDRLSRSVREVADVLHQAAGGGWRLLSLDLAVDTTTPQGEAMAHMGSVFAQLERRLIAQRTREALAAARLRGVRLGAPPAIDAATRSRVLRLYRRGHSAQWIALRLELAPRTVQRCVAAAVGHPLPYRRAAMPRKRPSKARKGRGANRRTPAA